MKQILVCLSILVVMMFPFSTVAKAETVNPIQQDYLQFDSFQKRYHDFMGELTYYMGTSYDSNDHYFRENMDSFRNALNSVYESRFLNNYLDSAEDLFAKPVALLSALPDLRGFIWQKIKDFFGKEEYPDYLYQTQSTSTAYVFVAPEGYKFRGKPSHLSAPNNYDDISVSANLINDNYIIGFSMTYPSNRSYNWTRNISGLNSSSSYAHLIPYAQKIIDRSITLVEVRQLVYELEGSTFEVVRVNDNSTISPSLVPPQQITNVADRIINNFNDGGRFEQDYSPNVVPLLVCPDGTKDLNYQDGVFYTNERSLQTVLINPDETATYNGMDCNLDFRFPSLDIAESGEITADGESLVRIPTLPSNPDEDYDYSLLGYIRNSYEYATSVVNTGVEGLRSIIIGTAGLVTFSSSLFGFLPPEILTLFIGGFSIALGLWVFKK